MPSRAVPNHAVPNSAVPNSAVPNNAAPSVLRGAAVREGVSSFRSKPSSVLPLRAVLALLVLLCGCQEPTQVRVELTTDIDCADAPQTGIAVGRASDIETRPFTTLTAQCDPQTGRIGSIVVVPADANDGELNLRVVTGLTRQADECVASGYLGGCVVARRRLGFLENETLHLPIHLEKSCIDVPCEASFTCRRGVCVSAAIDDPDGCRATPGCDVETPDAGVDSGVDAGPIDAGVDSGVDAGPIDAGVDGGAIDAGVDAGPIDAGFDAGTSVYVCQSGEWDHDADELTPCTPWSVCPTGALVAGSASSDVVCRSGVLRLAAHDSEHVCVLHVDRTVSCWGRNQQAQLGDGTSMDRSVPTPITGLTNVAALSPGITHSCALLLDGTVKCWGRNVDGQLGDGTTMQRVSPTVVPGLTNVVEVGAGHYHSCARHQNGTVSCWGDNSFGQLGDGTLVPNPSPQLVPGLSGVTGLAVGGSHNCVRLTSGTAFCWGNNFNGQVGDDSLTNPQTNPTGVLLLDDVTQIEAAGTHTCAVRSDATAACWGQNNSGQVGDGTIAPSRRYPRPVLSVSGISTLAASNNHNCALLSDATLKCWGNNVEGELADPSLMDQPTAIPVLGLAGVTQVATSRDGACALDGDGFVHCWGGNAYGQLGIGTTDPGGASLQRVLWP